MFNTLKYISRYIGTIFRDNCAETFNCLIGKETKDLDRDTVHTVWSISGIFHGGGGGGGAGGRSGTEGGPTRVTYFVEEGVFLKTSEYRDFVKVGYFFVPRYEVWGVKIPSQSTKYTRL